MNIEFDRCELEFKDWIYVLIASYLMIRVRNDSYSMV